MMRAELAAACVAPDRTAILALLRAELADVACPSGPKVRRNGGRGFTE